MDNPDVKVRTQTLKESLKSVTVPCKIDRKTFKRFAIYDTIVRRKCWRNPALFALIMSGFAAACFFARKTHAQATLLGGVLLGVGLVLPIVWFGMFFSSVSRQATRSGLSPDRAQYYVTLSEEKIHVSKGKETADFLWQDVYLARRVKGCFYLYVSPARAFLLPDGAESEQGWAIITAALDPEKIQDKS